MSRPDELAALDHTRGILERYLERIDDEGLQWRALPDAMPIGELVLHVAAFEYLTIAALARRDGREWNRDLWPGVAAGFARSAGFASPAGIGRTELGQTLAAVRAETVRHLGRSDSALRVAGLADAVTALAADLPSTGPPGDYDAVARAYGSSLADDGPPNADGRVSVIQLLERHECYHRGQITFEGYLLARAGD